MSDETSYPPVGFYFSVQLVTAFGMISSLFGSDLDNAFQEVSGISATVQTETVEEGGENTFVHKLPKRIEYPNLVLKRGFITAYSEFSDWVTGQMEDNLNSAVEPKHIMVSLLNEEGSVQVAWFFSGAWPVKIDISPLDASQSKIVVETMEFSYQYFEQVKNYFV